MTATIATETIPFMGISPLQRRMAEGHLIRRGHVLTGHYEHSVAYPGVLVLVRTCCKDD